MSYEAPMCTVACVVRVWLITHYVVLRKHPSYIIGDFGCGEARLAASVPNTVHSFDLIAANDTVVACDIAHVRSLSSNLHICKGVY